MMLVGVLQIQDRSCQLHLWLVAQRDRSCILTRPVLLWIRKFDKIYICTYFSKVTFFCIRIDKVNVFQYVYVFLWLEITVTDA